jgi:hypothetical protein
VGELETIARFRDLPAAQLARGRLEAEGIPAFLADQYFVGVNWQLSYAVGGIRLQVPYEHAEEARNILALDNSAALSDLQLSMAPVDAKDLCPSCGSADIRQNKLSRKSGAMSLLLGLPILFWGTRLSCEQCGQSWIPERSAEPFPDIPAFRDSDQPSSSSLEKTEWAWDDHLPLAILILMCLVTLVMLYEYGY